MHKVVFHEGRHKTIADVEYATADWVDWYYHRRLLGGLGMVSPDEFEATLLNGPQQSRIEAAVNPRSFTASRGRSARPARRG